MRLKDKVALVTGSSSGIGAGVALGLAAEGASVVVNYLRNAAGAEATAEAIRRLGRHATVIQADVGSGAAVDAMFDRIRRDFGRLDVLVNNAGLTLKRPFLECDEDDWDRLLATDLKSVFLCSRRAAEWMPRGGSILNISSIHAAVTTHNFAVYAAGKGGLEALTRAMAVELGSRGIRVNALRLGLINVERDAVRPGEADYAGVCARIPAGRPGEVADVAPMAALLCSAEASYVTGQVIAIDGGSGVTLNTVYPAGYVQGGAKDSRP